MVMPYRASPKPHMGATDRTADHTAGSGVKRAGRPAVSIQARTPLTTPSPRDTVLMTLIIRTAGWEEGQGGELRIVRRRHAFL